MTIAAAPCHASARAFERYGLELTFADLDQMMLDITDAIMGVRAAAVLQARLPGGTERWFVRVKGTTVRIVYDPATARVVTVLPLAQEKHAPQSVDNRRLRGRKPQRAAEQEVWE